MIFFSVSLLDTLQHDYLELEYELSPSIKKLLRFLCKMNENETLKVQRLNVAAQKDNGKLKKNILNQLFKNFIYRQFSFKCRCCCRNMFECWTSKLVGSVRECSRSFVLLSEESSLHIISEQGEKSCWKKVAKFIHMIYNKVIIKRNYLEKWSD